MDADAVEQVLLAFFTDVRRIFTAALARVRAATGSTSAVEANSKFDGFEGSFASLRDFHAGAEATLQLGYPNPNIECGISLEHTAHPSVTRHFVTPNYRLATCLLIEYWWAVDPSGPPTAARDLLIRLREDRDAKDDVLGGARRLAGGCELSLVRGESKDVDIDAETHTVTFRCPLPRLTHSAEHRPWATLAPISDAPPPWPQGVEHGRGMRRAPVVRHLLHGGRVARYGPAVQPSARIRRRQLCKR
jgi:hypothetical protein